MNRKQLEHTEKPKKYKNNNQNDTPTNSDNHDGMPSNGVGTRSQIDDELEKSGISSVKKNILCELKVYYVNRLFFLFWLAAASSNMPRYSQMLACNSTIIWTNYCRPACMSATMNWAICSDSIRYENALTRCGRSAQVYVYYLCRLAPPGYNHNPGT